MIRATTLLTAGEWDLAREVDKIELPHDGRHRRRVTMRAAADTVFLLDLPDATLLRDGDGLQLESGGVVRVIAASEPLLEITGDQHLLSRVAWHLGNRHVPAQIMANAVRLAPDHVLAEMLKQLGAKVSHIDAPFYPEAGAYAHSEHVKSHNHHHSHAEHNHDH